MMIVFDENTDQVLINLAKERKFKFISIREDFSGIKDREVINIAIDNEAIIVTEDKDFGELVYSFNYKVSVILIRSDKPISEFVKDGLIKVLKIIESSDDKMFAVITPSKIRVKSI